MFETGILGLVGEVLDADPAVCDRAGLDHLVGVMQRIHGWADAVDVVLARRANELVDAGTCASAQGVLEHHGRRSAREAKAVGARSAVCGEMPSFQDALAHGTVSAGHIDALAVVARSLDDDGRAELAAKEAVLLAAAVVEPVSMFERRCRELARRITRDEGEARLAQQKAAASVRRWVDRHTGMFHTHLEHDPETGTRLWTQLDAHLATLQQADANAGMPIERLTAQAVVELVCGARSSDPRVPEISVLIDYATLVDGLHRHSVCETADGTLLPPASIRRLACEAAIVPIVLAGTGEALDVGRQYRVANRAQRRALRAMYRTCAHPDCHVPFEHCQIHHVVPWELGGPTDLANLIPLCNLHHHLVHERRWRLTLTPDRHLTITRPDGTTEFEGYTTNRKPHPDPTCRTGEVQRRSATGAASVMMRR